MDIDGLKPTNVPHWNGSDLGHSPSFGHTVIFFAGKRLTQGSLMLQHARILQDWPWLSISIGKTEKYLAAVCRLLMHELWHQRWHNLWPQPWPPLCGCLPAPTSTPVLSNAWLAKIPWLSVKNCSTSSQTAKIEMLVIYYGIIMG